MPPRPAKPPSSAKPAASVAAPPASSPAAGNTSSAPPNPADVLRQEVLPLTRPSILPREIEEAEGKMIRQRRREAGVPEVSEDNPMVGLALSGGGIRSATFCLGFLQSLAGRKLLRRVDYMATVSGGGYTGGFLGRFYTRGTAPLPSEDHFLPESPCPVPEPAPEKDPKSAPEPEKEKDQKPAADAGNGKDPKLSQADVVERELADSQSRTMRWLRENARYLAPSGRGDWLRNFAWYFRNLISVWFALGLLLFGVILGLDVLRQWCAPVLDLPLMTESISNFESHVPVLGRSRWILLPAFCLVWLVYPLIWGYWLARRGEEFYYRPPLAPRRVLDTPVLWGVLVLILATLVGGILTDGSIRWTLWGATTPMILSIPLIFSWRWYLARWHCHTEESLQMAIRSEFSSSLAITLGMLTFAIYFVFIDGLGHVIAEEGFGKVATVVGAALTVTPGILMKALTFFRGSGTESKKSRLAVPLGLLATVGGVLLLTGILAVFSAAAHLLFHASPRAAVWVAGGCLIISIIFSGAWSFLNQSSLQNMYSARLARAWLGASNQLRRSGNGRSVTETVPGDDCPLAAYKPHETGGPVHLIGVTINETDDLTNEREIADRKGLGLCAGPWGLSVGRSHHACWEGNAGAVKPLRRPMSLFHPLDSVEVPRYLPSEEPDSDYRYFFRWAQYPFFIGRFVRYISQRPWRANKDRDSVGGKGVPCEALTLRYWLGISGAAFTTGIGARTNRGLSLLAGLAGVRLGWWWDSGIDAWWRPGVQRRSFLQRMLRLPATLFPMQSVIFSELGASFGGPSQRLWYLSDGGHFENTALYELIRRRVPIMICCDCGADPEYNLADLANLVRKARMDFNAEVSFLSQKQLNKHLPDDLLTIIGPVEQLQSADSFKLNANPAEGNARHHAALAAVYYDNCATPSSILLLVKPSMSGDEPADVINYAREHDDFPQEPTMDQIFDEGQWESYRRLGEHIGALLFASGDAIESKDQTGANTGSSKGKAGGDAGGAKVQKLEKWRPSSFKVPDFKLLKTDFKPQDDKMVATIATAGNSDCANVPVDMPPAPVMPPPEEPPPAN